ncbi:MAG: hypothetical protein LDL19_06320 [Thiobacillus sp.]|nr:hypothetical protein [Thiobacillus sp.]
MFSGARPHGASAIRRVAWAQAALIVPAALAGALVAGRDAGIATTYGVLVALFVSLVLVRRERQAMRHPEWDQHRLFRLFILAGVERLVVLVGLLALGMAGLKLPPLPVLLGLLGAQFAWLAAARR